MYQAAVLPAPSRHRMSVVPLLLKSPVAITSQPAADRYMGVLEALPCDISQPATLPSALFFHMTSVEPLLLKSPVATTRPAGARAGGLADDLGGDAVDVREQHGCRRTGAVRVPVDVAMIEQDRGRCALRRRTERERDAGGRQGAGGAEAERATSELQRVAFGRGEVDERIDAVRRSVEVEVVGAAAALDGVVVALAPEVVGAAAALERIVLVATGEEIVALTARRACRHRRRP